MGTIKGSEKVPDFVFTQHRQVVPFHLAPFRNRFQIAPVRVTFSHNFDPVSSERKGVLLRLFSAVFISLRTRVNAKAFYCDVLAPFSTCSGLV